MKDLEPKNIAIIICNIKLNNNKYTNLIGYHIQWNIPKLNNLDKNSILYKQEIRYKNILDNCIILHLLMN